MGREWKPGDVAMVRGVPCIRLSSGLWEHGKPDQFAYNEPAARPLVVIDPEDREQVARLADIFTVAEDPREIAASSHRIDAMQAALREFASPTPPKPDEPTGLGAVVVDANGKRWVRATESTETDCAWVRAEQYKTRGVGWIYESYSMCVNAVEVLSEGVIA